MSNINKIICSIIGIIIFTLGAIIASIQIDTVLGKTLAVIIWGSAAFIDAFVFMIPYIFCQASIKSSNMLPELFNYRKSCFVDRFVQYKDIIMQINRLEKNDNNTLWIRLHGESGVGKKTLISKLFYKYSKHIKNKFYFIRFDKDLKLLDLMKQQFPLTKGEQHDGVYLKTISRARRTFIIIDREYSELNLEITELFVLWQKKVKKTKLFIISCNHSPNTGIGTNPSHYNLVEYDLTNFSHTDSLSYVNKTTKIKLLETKDKIVSLSNGHPALLSFICETYNTNTKYYENDLTKTLRLYDKEKSTFFQLCVLTLVFDRLGDNIIKIFDKDHIDKLISSKILEKLGDFYYIPPWYLSVVRMQNNQKQFKECLERLEGKNLAFLDDFQFNKAKMLVEKDINAIYNEMNELDKACKYSEIIDFNDKLSLAFDYDIENHKKIILIILQAFLKLGEYDRFYYMQNKYSKKVPIIIDISDEDYLFNFLLADYYHLTSDYNTSNTIFEMLQHNTSKGKIQKNNLNFYIAHNHRHQGSFVDALKLFNEVIKHLPKDDVLHKRAVTAIIAIENFAGDRDDVKTWIDTLENMIDKNDDVKYNIYRHIANVKRRFEETLDEAIELLQQQIESLEKKNLRLIHDYYFELGECFRKKAIKDSAFIELSHTYYNKAFIFSELNHDKNLKIATQIGKLLLNFIEDNNIKKLEDKLCLLTKEAPISLIFDLCINTILSIIKNTNSIETELIKNNYQCYVKVLHNRNIASMPITVM